MVNCLWREVVQARIGTLKKLTVAMESTSESMEAARKLLKEKSEAAGTVLNTSGGHWDYDRYNSR